MATKTFDNAKKNKADEFYTQMEDIFREVEAYLEFDPNVFKGKTVLCPCDDPYESNFFKYFALRFNELGLKKLIATCYVGSPIANTQLSLFDDEPVEDKTTKNPHKIEITEFEDYNCDGVIDLLDVEWLLENKKNALTRLEGDGDFRSDEIKKLRDECDVIITNPPFSMFREFLAWIMEANKQFLIIGNVNAITYKEVFPLIKENKMWLGKRFNSRINGKNMTFAVPSDYPLNGTETYIDDKGNKFVSVAGTGWFTNIDHGRRHQPMQLMTMSENLRYNNGLIKKLESRKAYDKYDSYDAIDVPFTDAIPSDYDGTMGVPISFLNQYCPEQFEIIGIDRYVEDNPKYGHRFSINGKEIYARVLIKRKGDTQFNENNT